MLIDLLPVVAFVVAYMMYDIMVATAVVMGATVLVTLWGWWRHGTVQKMHLISMGLILVLGGATLYFADERFVKAKPSVLYIVMALAFFGSRWTEKTLTERMYKAIADDIPRAVLGKINNSWVAFFLLLSGLNAAVAMNYDTATWVKFKLFGLMGLTLIFVLAQAVYLARWTRVENDRDEEQNES
jgi:intracellular septation protein